MYDVVFSVSRSQKQYRVYIFVRINIHCFFLLYYFWYPYTCRRGVFYYCCETVSNRCWSTDTDFILFVILASHFPTPTKWYLNTHALFFFHPSRLFSRNPSPSSYPKFLPYTFNLLIRGINHYPSFQRQWVYTQILYTFSPRELCFWWDFRCRHQWNSE